MTTQMLPTLPPEAKPAERAILYAYFNGVRQPMDIARLLRPNSKQEVYRTLKKYSELLPTLRVGAPTQHFFGNGLICSP